MQHPRVLYSDPDPDPDPGSDSSDMWIGAACLSALLGLICGRYVQEWTAVITTTKAHPASQARNVNG